MRETAWAALRKLVNSRGLETPPQFTIQHRERHQWSRKVRELRGRRSHQRTRVVRRGCRIGVRPARVRTLGSRSELETMKPETFLKAAGKSTHSSRSHDFVTQPQEDDAETCNDWYNNSALERWEGQVPRYVHCTATHAWRRREVSVARQSRPRRAPNVTRSSML